GGWDGGEAGGGGGSGPQKARGGGVGCGAGGPPAAGASAADLRQCYCHLSHRRCHRRLSPHHGAVERGAAGADFPGSVSTAAGQSRGVGDIRTALRSGLWVPADAVTDRSPPCHSVQRLGEVGQQILRVLTASAEPDKAFWDGIPAPASAPFCGRVQSAKTGGFIDQLAGGEKRLGVLTVGENKTHHRPKALHLAYGDGIRR